MIVIPAIDLMDNKCVRLEQGNFDAQTVYSEDPLLTAKFFEKAGFTHLHMVDLDGARKKELQHLHILKTVSAVTGLFIDYSGGLRSAQHAKDAFENGASAITLGSMAVHDKATTLDILSTFGPEKVILGADVKNRKIATAGWKEASTIDIFSFLEEWTAKGFSKVMITDVAKDGMMQGPSLELYAEVMKEFPQIRLIASGGIAGIDDVIKLKDLGCYAAITGKAIYEKTLDFSQINTITQKT